MEKVLLLVTSWMASVYCAGIVPFSHCRDANCSSVSPICSGAALYEISLQRDIAMREAEAIAQLQLIQEAQRLELQHQHASEIAQV